MTYPTYDLTLEQGVTSTLNITITDASGSIVDVTGWTFNGTIKEGTNIFLPIIADLNVFITDAANGNIAAELTAEEAEKLVKPKYFYDIIGKKPDTSVVRVVQGKVSVNLAVTSLTDT